MKTCSKCKIEKENIEFYYRDKALNKLRSQCKSCTNTWFQKPENKSKKQKYNAAYRQDPDNKLRIQEYRTAYRQDPENKLKEQEYHTTYNQDPDNKLKSQVSDAHKRAKKKNIPFDLKAEDLSIPERCEVLGIPLYRNVGTGRASPNSPSIDRIKPELGYVPGNVRIISNRANTIKNDATIEDLEKVLEYMKRHNNG